MALINCPECKREISDAAKQCPHCGFPISEMNNAPSNVSDKKTTGTSQKKKSKKGLLIGGIAAIVVLLGIGLWWVLGKTGVIGEKVIILDDFTNKINSHEYEVLTMFNDGLAVVKENGKYGVIDKNGDIVVPLLSRYISPYNEGMAPSSEESIISTKLNSQNDLYILRSKSNSKIGFVDKSGELVISMQYDYVCNFSEGLAAVGKKDGKFGYIDTKGNTVIPMEFDLAGDFHDGFAIVYNGNYGFINKNGVIAISTQYSNARSFHEGLAAVCKDNKWGFIDINGTVVVPIEYDIVGDFNEGLTYVNKGNKTCFIDKKGKEKEILSFSYFGELHEGLLAVKKNGKYGFVNTKGNIVIPLEFDDVSDFHEGVALVCKNHKVGFVNKKGEIVVPLEYDAASDFSEGLAVVQKDNTLGYVDKFGNTTLTNDYLQRKREERMRLEEERLRLEEEERNRTEIKKIRVSFVRQMRDDGRYGDVLRDVKCEGVSGVQIVGAYVLTDEVTVPYGKKWTINDIRASNITGYPIINRNGLYWREYHSGDSPILLGGDNVSFRYCSYLNRTVIVEIIITEERYE